MMLLGMVWDDIIGKSNGGEDNGRVKYCNYTLRSVSETNGLS